MAPSEAKAVAENLLRFGLAAGSNAGSVWLGAGFVPVTTLIDWNWVGPWVLPSKVHENDLE